MKHSDRIDFHAFRDLWSRSNFLDPLNIRSLEAEEEVRQEAAELAQRYLFLFFLFFGNALPHPRIRYLI